MPAVAVLSEVPRSTPRLAPARPILKWVGGKRKVIPHLLKHIPENMGTYHEPFVGGGALFFSMAERMAQQGRDDRWAVLTDMNLRLIRTYRGIQQNVGEVIERLAEHRAHHEKDYYYEVRARDVDAASGDAEVAAWMIYLNKTGFNGLYRVNRKGGFNVPFGKYTNPKILDEPNLRATNRALQQVQIRHADYTEVFFRAEPGDVVYFDPPYVPLSKTASFTAYTRAGFGPDDQVKLRDLALEMKQRGVHVLLSNHDTPEVRELYKDFDIHQVMVGRAINSKASGRGRVAEVVVC